MPAATNSVARAPVWDSSPPIVAKFTEWVLSGVVDSLLEIPIHFREGGGRHTKPL